MRQSKVSAAARQFFAFVTTGMIRRRSLLRHGILRR